MGLSSNHSIAVISASATVLAKSFQIMKEQASYILCKLNQGRDVPVRYSCASYSFLQVFNGAMDAYISMKERWTNIAPLYHFAEILGYYISIDINTVPKNEDFTLALATPQFAKNHLNEGSELAVFMGITKF